MTPIVHITPREQALMRENERLTDQVKRQSATIHVQAVAIQAMQDDAERYRFMRDKCQWIASSDPYRLTKLSVMIPAAMVAGCGCDDLDNVLDAARKEQS